jgi:hypothetical protein
MTLNPIKISVFSLIGIVTISCASNTQPKIDAYNYREYLNIKRKNISFYSAKHVDKSSERICFPPIEKMICHTPSTESKEIPYEKTGSLDIEQFEFKFSSKGIQDNKTVNDFIMLSAADLARQRGYPLAVKLTENNSSSCGSSYSATTTGNYSYYGGYRGETTLHENISCSTRVSAEFIFLKERDPLKNGVFYLRGEDKNNFEKLRVFAPLYYGTSQFNWGTGSGGVPNAWNEVYSTESLSAELRGKYKANNDHPYTFDDEAMEIEKGRNDPVERSKLPPQ